MQLYFKEGTNEPVQWNSYGVWLDIDVGLNSWILDFKDEMVPCFILVGAMEWFSSLFGSRDGMECLFHLPSHEDHATAPALTSLRLCSSPRAELAPPSYPTAHTQPKRRGVICSFFSLLLPLSCFSSLFSSCPIAFVNILIRVHVRTDRSSTHRARDICSSWC